MVQPARTVDDRTNPLLTGEAGYRALARHFPNGSVVLFDRDLRYAIADGAGLAEFGLTKADLEGKTIWEAFPADVAEFLRPKFEAALLGESVSFEVSQDERLYSARVVPVEDDADRIIGGMVMTQNVTSERGVERALREAEARYRSFVETTREWIWAIDRDGQHLYSNPAVTAILGYRPEELTGSFPMELMHEDDRRRITELFPRWVEQREGWSGMVVRWRHCDGSDRYLESSSVPILDDAGELVGYRGADRDVTERVLAEQERHRLLSQMVQAQEQERRDLAADIHDDQIQKMTAVGLRLEAMRRSVGEPRQVEALTQAQETVAQSITRLRTLVFDLHPRALDAEGLAAALRLHLQDLEDEAGMQCTFDNQLVAEPSSNIRLIAYRVAKEALTNVRKHAQATEVRVTLVQQETDLRISIRDNGCGRGDQEELPNQVGFSSMRERVRLAGGRLRVTSKPEGGTLLDVELPLADPG